MKDKNILAILAATAAGLSLLTFFLISPLFRISEIELTALFFNQEEAVLEKAGLRKNQHFLASYGGSLNAILTGRYLPVERRILESFPEIRAAEVLLEFPGRVRIIIDERIPVAFLQIPDGSVMLDREGVACGVLRKTPLGIPAIRGITVLNMQLGKKLQVDAPDALEQCVGVMSSIVEADFEQPDVEPLLPQVLEIRSSGYRRVNLKIQPRGTGELLMVSCSQNHYLKGHFIWLSEVLNAGILQNELPGRLDLSGKQQIFTPEKKDGGGSDYVWQDELYAVEEAVEYVEESDGDEGGALEGEAEAP